MGKEYWFLEEIRINVPYGKMTISAQDALGTEPMETVQVISTSQPGMKQQEHSLRRWNGMAKKKWTRHALKEGLVAFVDCLVEDEEEMRL